MVLQTRATNIISPRQKLRLVTVVTTAGTMASGILLSGGAMSAETVQRARTEMCLSAAEADIPALAVGPPEVWKNLSSVEWVSR